MKNIFTSVCLALIVMLAIAGNVQSKLSEEDVEIMRLRARSEGWTFEIGENSATKYSLEQLCGHIEPNDLSISKTSAYIIEQTEDLPESFDWREIAGYPSVRDQGGCGACWAFATIGVLEFDILIQDGVERDLSEQWLVSCNSNNYGCWGGNAFEAFQYFEWGGIYDDPSGDSGAVLEEDFPYVQSKVPCACPYDHYYYTDSWSLYNAQDINDLKQVIMTYGPVYASVAATYSFQYYNGGVFNSCSSASPNHAVVIVGWDDDPPDGRPDCPGVWIIRNSWGQGWGEGGYMRIEYGCSGIDGTVYYMNYIPRDFIVSPLREARFVGEQGSDINPAAFEYTLINNNAVNDIDWTINHDESWLSVVPDHGTLGPVSKTTVQVFINSQADFLTPDDYTDTLTFSASSGHVYQQSADLTIQSLDYFTERMPNYQRLINYQMLTLTPHDCPSSYTACTRRVFEFPTDPTGATELTLANDDYVQVNLSPGRQVKLYGQSYDSFYVGSNGYITFEQGDTDDARTFNNHFRLKRISALLEELNPASGGTVSVKELQDRVVVTFDDVAPFSNNFQIEMFYSGTIRITWLYIFVQWPVLGISNGQGIPPDFAQSDISAYQISNADVYCDCIVDFLDFSVFGLAWRTTPADENWDINCEFSVPVDGLIDSNDLQVLVNDWLVGY